MELTSHGVIAADHPALAGHFPGNPVVPGVVVLEQVLQLAQQLPPDMPVRGVDGVKFLQPLLPQQPFVIQLQSTDRPRRWRFDCTRQGQRIATGFLLLETAP